jgi:hypothetical protein
VCSPARRRRRRINRARPWQHGGSSTSTTAGSTSSASSRWPRPWQGWRRSKARPWQWGSQPQQPHACSLQLAIGGAGGPSLGAGGGGESGGEEHAAVEQQQKVRETEVTRSGTERSNELTYEKTKSGFVVLGPLPQAALNPVWDRLRD